MSIVENPKSDNSKKVEEVGDGLPVWIETDDDMFMRGHLRTLGRALAVNIEKGKSESAKVEEIVPKKSA